MAKHAVKSPSSAKRWMTCPGSLKLSEGRKDTSNEYAEEGTAAHFLGAVCLQGIKNAADYVGQVIELLEDEQGEHYEDFQELRPAEVKLLSSFIVDEDMARYVQVYVDYVRDLVKSSGGVLFVEVSVPLDHLTGEEGATGTSDAVILAPDELIVVDLKFGRGVEVSAIENEQERIYSSGTFRWIEEIIGGTDEIKRVRLAISQPRLSSLPSEWSCTIEELHAFEDEVRKASAICDAASAAFHDTRGVRFDTWIDEYLHVSEEGCRFCKAKATCSKLASHVEESMGTDFENLDKVPPVNDPMDNTLLAKHLASVDIIESWCKAVRAEVESQLLQGNDVPGYKLVQGRKGNRSWSSEQEAEEVLKKLKLKKEEMYSFKIITPTVAEKLLGKDEKKWPKVQAIITQAEGSPSVAPVADSRPAIIVNKPEVSDFTNLDEDLA